MAKKKANAQEKADAFLAGLGTAGGAIGSPGLVTFGAGDTQRQVITGNMDNNWAAKEQQMVEDAAMPQNLDASYLKLNLPGSPLPMNGLTAAQNLNASISNQKMFLSHYQMTLAQMMPPGGFQQLPMGLPPVKKK
tara:strand:+ start:228 stop:632 length:405 start_codon:yes stop_codon:yes gene_type:complete